MEDTAGFWALLTLIYLTVTMVKHHSITVMLTYYQNTYRQTLPYCICCSTKTMNIYYLIKQWKHLKFYPE